MSTAWRLLGGAALGGMAWATCLAQGTAPAAASSVASCVEVSVNQQSVLGFTCLSQALMPHVRGAAVQPTLDAFVTEPSNRQLGQFNFSAFSQRMGSNLGKSVLPQRPPAAVAEPPAAALAPKH